MVLGITRARPRFEGGGVFVVGPAARDTVWNQDWPAERGAIRFQAAVDVNGGYPGFAQSGVALRHAGFRVSDSYLLVDEGHTHGFGLPIQWLDGAAIIARPGREAPALRVFYRDGAAARHFTIRFRHGWRSLRRGCQAERVRQLLLDLGLPDRHEDREPSAPDLRVSWEDARRFEAENVIWRGKAAAPALLGEETAPADVWLTTRSVIWGVRDGDGVNRLSLEAVSDVITGQADGRATTPAVYLAFLDTALGQVRFDLPFVFDQYSSERNLRERGAFLVGLRSRGVALGLPAPLIQPWRMNVHRVGAFPGWPARDFARHSEEETGLLPAMTNRCLEFVGELARQLPAPERLARIGPLHAGEPSGRDQDHDPANEVLALAAVEADEEQDGTVPLEDTADVMLAEYSAPTETDDGTAEPLLSTDIALSSDWYEPPDIQASEATPKTIPADQPSPAELNLTGIGDPPRLECTRAYEAANLALLSEALIAIRDRAAGLAGRPLSGAVPSHDMEMAASAELKELETTGQMTAAEARVRRVRLTAISEAARRLRSLVELRDAGHLTDADLALKRAEISDELSGLILAGSGLGDRR